VSQNPTIFCSNFDRHGSDATFVGGNPWQWISNSWHLKSDFDVQRDFPVISLWVTKISPASLKMYFKHDASKNNNSNKEQNGYSNENTGNGNFLDFSKLKADFPDTEHKVFIVGTLKLTSALERVIRGVLHSVLEFKELAIIRVTF
jgi:hypothetical protein